MCHCRIGPWEYECAAAGRRGPRNPEESALLAASRVEFLTPLDRSAAHFQPRRAPIRADAIRRYLAAAQTRSARELAVKAVVLIYPTDRSGEVVWPIGIDSA